MKKLLLTIALCFCVGITMVSAAVINSVIAAAPIPSSVNVVIKANMKNDAIAYNLNDDDILLTVSLANTQAFAIEPDNLQYDVYLRANDPVTHQFLQPVFVGSGQLLIATIPVNGKLTLQVPAGASAWIGGQEVFSSISTIGNNYYPNIQNTPHPQGIYTVRVRFSGHNVSNAAQKVIGETYIGFGINTQTEV